MPTVEGGKSDFVHRLRLCYIMEIMSKYPFISVVKIVLYNLIVHY